MKDLPETGGVVTAADLAGLARFARPDCPAAIWPRGLPPEVQSWLDALPSDHLPRGRLTVLETAVEDAVLQLCEAAGTPDGPERRWLVADIAALAATVFPLTEARFLRLRLDVITTNACRKFHIDAVRARLVCTYRGTGTQFGYGDQPQEITTAPTGAPLLLRGTLWPPSPDPGLRHRSPPNRRHGRDAPRSGSGPDPRARRRDLTITLDPKPRDTTLG